MHSFHASGMCLKFQTSKNSVLFIDAQISKLEYVGSDLALRNTIMFAKE